MDIKIKPIKTVMYLIFFTILLWWAFDNFKFIAKGIGLFLEILSPFIIGLVIAFIFNKPMSYIERKLFSKKGRFYSLKDKYKRPLSFLTTLMIFIIIFVIVLVIIVPNLVAAGEELAEKLPKYWENMQDYIEHSSIKYFQINNWIQGVDLNEINDSLSSFIQGRLLNWLGSTFDVFSSVIGGIISAGIGLVFAVYFLFQKEDLILSIKKLIYASFPLKVAERIVYIGLITRESFSQFLTGQTLDALALGLLFFISMMIFGFPYAMMISIIIAICAFIPIVGAFIGLVIGGFLIFVESPKLAGFFVILFFVLQQLEENFIYPKVVGKASGLSSVWILAAVILGGSFMGIIGIILFVPMFSVMQKLLKEYTDKRLEEKGITDLEDNNPY